MPDIKSFKDLERYLNKKINKVMSTKVSNEARQTMKEHIVTDVYEAYQSIDYERTGELLDDKNIETKLVSDGTLSVRSTRHDGDRDIAKIIESGRGYSYEGLDERIGSRPFTEKTAIDLKDGTFENTLKNGLKQEGMDIT